MGKKNRDKISRSSFCLNNFRECYLLDDAGLDHGELSTIDKHVIVGKNKNTIIDFESSSTNRKPSNVTGATQGILIGTGLAKIIQKKVKLPPKETIINLIRQYKKNPNLENFEKITIGLKLQTPGRFEVEVSLLRSDKKLGPLIRRIGPCSMRITKSVSDIGRGNNLSAIIRARYCNNKEISKTLQKISYTKTGKQYN